MVAKESELAQAELTFLELQRQASGLEPFEDFLQITQVLLKGGEETTMSSKYTAHVLSSDLVNKWQAVRVLLCDLIQGSVWTLEVWVSTGPVDGSVMLSCNICCTCSLMRRFFVGDMR